MNEVLAQIITTTNSIVSKLSEKFTKATEAVSERVLQNVRNILTRIDNKIN